MLIEKSTEVRLAHHPEGTPQAEDFRTETVVVAAPATGEVQVRNTWMSVDPYMRGRMHGKDTYLPGFKLDEPLTGYAVGVVTASESPLFMEGDTVLSFFGWREAFNAPADALTKLDATKLSPELYLGVAGLTGLTAYVGILEIAKIKKGDVLFVTAAAGAVGSVVCQIAKLKGAYVIGSAGGPKKCEFLRELGVDYAIDYKNTSDFEGELRTAAPDGLDICFDNVGGSQLDAALRAAKPFARFVICGRISTYNDVNKGSPSVDPHHGDHLDPGNSKNVSFQGLLVSDYFHLMPRFVDEMTEWIHSKKIVATQTVEVGIDHAVPAFLKLFTGENTGKMLVRLA